MTVLVLIRHAPTQWNAAKRLQGRSDLPLSADGMAQLGGWHLPDDLKGADLLSSPLLRARDTARRLTGREPEVDMRLTEMDFGAWEGHSLADLRAEDPDGMAAQEGRGWDMTPPGGESPRMVWTRVAPLLAELAGRAGPIVAVTHRGVMRAIMAQAIGWDFLGKPPAKLQGGTLQRLWLGDDGAPKIIAMNEVMGKGTAT